MADAGVPVHVLRKISGHGSLTTTLRYLHPNPQLAGGSAMVQLIHPADGVLSFAGLCELWSDPAKDADDPDRWLWSAAIITHHATWLAGVMNDPHLTDKDAVQRLMSGIEYEPLQVRAVSTAVNKTGRGASRGPELIEPIDEYGDQPLHLVPA